MADHMNGSRAGTSNDSEKVSLEKKDKTPEEHSEEIDGAIWRMHRRGDDIKRIMANLEFCELMVSRNYIYMIIKRVPLQDFTNYRYIAKEVPVEDVDEDTKNLAEIIQNMSKIESAVKEGHTQTQETRPEVMVEVAPGGLAQETEEEKPRRTKTVDEFIEKLQEDSSRTCAPGSNSSVSLHWSAVYGQGKVEQRDCQFQKVSCIIKLLTPAYGKLCEADSMEGLKSEALRLNKADVVGGLWDDAILVCFDDGCGIEDMDTLQSHKAKGHDEYVLVGSKTGTVNELALNADLAVKLYYKLLEIPADAFQRTIREWALDQKRHNDVEIVALCSTQHLLNRIPGVTLRELFELQRKLQYTLDETEDEYLANLGEAEFKEIEAERVAKLRAIDEVATSGDSQKVSFLIKLMTYEPGQMCEADSMQGLKSEALRVNGADNVDGLWDDAILVCFDDGCGIEDMDTLRSHKAKGHNEYLLVGSKTGSVSELALNADLAVKLYHKLLEIPAIDFRSTIRRWAKDPKRRNDVEIVAVCYPQHLEDRLPGVAPWELFEFQQNLQHALDETEEEYLGNVAEAEYQEVQ